MPSVYVSLRVPKGVDQYDYRDRAEARATELGFPSICGAGCSIGQEPAEADLDWEVDNPDLIADVVTTLVKEFDVRHLSVVPDEV